MDVSEILFLARFETGNVDTDLADADLVKILNARQKEIGETIKTQIDSKFFYDEYRLDTVIGQIEYNNLPVSKIDAAYIKYRDNDTYYKKMTPIDAEEQDVAPDELRARTPEVAPLVAIKDDSVFIYPVASEAVTGGLQLFGRKPMTTLTAASLEADVFNGKIIEFHNILNLAIQPSIYRNEQRFNEANDAENVFQTKLQTMLEDISNRYSQPIQYKEPNLTSYI